MLAINIVEGNRCQGAAIAPLARTVAAMAAVKSLTLILAITSTAPWMVEQSHRCIPVDNASHAIFGNPIYGVVQQEQTSFKVSQQESG